MHLTASPGWRVYHQGHCEGEPCQTGVTGCYHDRTLLGRLLDAFLARRTPPPPPPGRGAR